MSTPKVVIIAVVVFGLGYTIGQGHKPLDFNGDGVINMNDVRYVQDSMMRKGE